jgi:predicted Ser/Thr protein kinase
MTCPDDDTLAAVATLREAERAAIADHAASCDSCRPLVTRLLGVPTQGSFADADTLAGAPPSLASGIPTTIDRYRIQSRIGAGAMGVVYSGYDPELARPVAIKVLRSGGSPERMKREAQTLAQLAHANVVAVYDVGEHENSTFVTMALVDGDNLRTWLQTPRNTREIVDALAQAARGLEVAHAAGIVHRDIKPDNIFVAKNGTVLVGDFGLARTTGQRSDVDPDLIASSELTQTGALVGTPAYMAPEQIDGEASAASDQFALCVTAWEALYGQRPFTGKSLAELVAAVNAGPPPSPRTRSVPSHVRAAIRRGLAADPKARHPSMTALLAALANRRRWPIVAAGVAMLAVIGVAGVMLLREDPEEVCEAIAAPSGWKVPAEMPPAVAAVVERILGRYAADWHTLAKSSCIAAARRELSAPAYAATQRCLELRENTLLWIVKQDADVLGRAEALEPIETCRGLTDVTSPSPALSSLQLELARTTVSVQHEPEKATGLDELLARAKKLDDATSIAQVEYLRGLAAHARGLDPTESLQAAIATAERARDDRIRTRASALLAIVTARNGRLSEAIMRRDTAASAAARANDAVSTIAVERATIELAYIQRDFDAQFAGYRRIEALLIARFGDLSHSLVDTRFMHAGQLIRRKEPDGSRILDLAVEGWKQLNGATDAIALERATMAETNPRVRLPMQEKLVELVRRGAPAELPKQLEVLAFDYELVGAYERALQTMREAIALETSEVRLEVAAYDAFEIADRSDSDAIRAQHLAEALALLDRLPDAARDRDSVQAIRGRILLRAGRADEAVPLLTRALEAAERKEPQEPFHIGIRSFALAQALWQIGGKRERDRAIALAEQAERRLPEVRDDLTAFQEGVLVGRLDEQLVRIAAWRRTHR